MDFQKILTTMPKVQRFTLNHSSFNNDRTLIKILVTEIVIKSEIKFMLL